jgi:hypothetical protein
MISALTRHDFILECTVCHSLVCYRPLYTLILYYVGPSRMIQTHMMIQKYFVLNVFLTMMVISMAWKNQQRLVTGAGTRILLISYPFKPEANFYRECVGVHLAKSTFWLVAASLLSVFNFDKAKDKDGNDIAISTEMDNTLVSSVQFIKTSLMLFTNVSLCQPSAPIRVQYYTKR